MRHTKTMGSPVGTRFPEELWRDIHRAAEKLSRERGLPVNKADVIREGTVRYVRMVLAEGA